MIAKAIKGKGFRGALEYDLSKEEGRVIDTNMNGDGARQLAAEFGEIRKLRPALSKAVLHVSLSAAPGEHLTDAQWTEIGQRYLNGMGLDRNQYIITRIFGRDGPLLFRCPSGLRRIGAGLDLLLHFQALVARSRQSHDRVGAEGQAVLLAVGLCVAQPP
jgi:hypothetical protein